MDATAQFFAISERYCRSRWLGRRLIELDFMYDSHFWGRVWINVVATCCLSLALVEAFVLFFRYDEQIPAFLQGLVWGIILVVLVILIAWLANKRHK